LVAGEFALAGGRCRWSGALPRAAASPCPDGGRIESRRSGEV